MWQVTGDRWHVTHDTWHVTRDTWQMTDDTWHMTYSVGWTFSQNFSSLSLPVWDWECLEVILTKVSVTHSMDRGDCRTAPSTPGLLKTVRNGLVQYKFNIHALVFPVWKEILVITMAELICLAAFYCHNFLSLR